MICSSAVCKKIEFVSVQKGSAASQISKNTKLPLVRGQDAVSKSLDFCETAAVLANCDLVISADSSVVHLAGALSVPTWVALSWVPEWRWGLEGNQTRWYESVRLFRQRARGDWKSVVRELIKEMERLFL